MYLVYTWYLVIDTRYTAVRSIYVPHPSRLGCFLWVTLKKKPILSTLVPCHISKSTIYTRHARCARCRRETAVALQYEQEPDRGSYIIVDYLLFWYMQTRTPRGMSSRYRASRSLTVRSREHVSYSASTRGAAIMVFKRYHVNIRLQVQRALLWYMHPTCHVITPPV